MKMQSIKNQVSEYFEEKRTENLLKYPTHKFPDLIWFPEYNFKTPKYIKNI